MSELNKKMDNENKHSNEIKDDTFQEEESPHLNFTNEPSALFQSIEVLENRYIYSIKKIKERLDQEIQETQKENGEKYRKALENKKKNLLENIARLNTEIYQSIKKLDEQEQNIVEQINETYKKNAKKLEHFAFEILEFDF